MQNEVVVDTSVLIKFFFEERDSGQARLLYNDFRAGRLKLLTLDFLFLEFVNVLWTKTASGHLQREEAEQILHVAAHFAREMEVVSSVTVLASAFEASYRFNHAAYDTALFVLAEERGIAFVTADEKFYRKAAPRSRTVRLLRNWMAS